MRDIYFNKFIGSLDKRTEGDKMVAVPESTTVLTDESHAVLQAMLDEVTTRLMVDMDSDRELSDRAVYLFNKDFHRLREIKRQLALSMLVLQGGES